MATSASRPAEETGAPAVGEGEKLVWLVRHGESTNNVRKRVAADAARGLRRGRLPTRAALATMAPMLALPMDSPLSARGRAQVARTRAALARAELAALARAELVVHSPLRRAAPVPVRGRPAPAC